MMLSVFAAGCEKEAPPALNLTKWYEFHFDRSPGKFLLKSGGNSIPAANKKMTVDIEYTYSEMVGGEYVGTHTKTMSKSFNTDTSGNLSLQFDLRGNQEIEMSRESFQIATSQVTVPAGTSSEKYVRIGQINALKVTIKIVSNGKTYSHSWGVGNESYFWDIAQGFMDYFNGEYPKFEARSLPQLHFSERDATQKDYWFIKLVDDIILEEQL